MEQIQTKRLKLTLANPGDLPALEELEKECEAYFRFDPESAAEYNRSLRECLAVGDMIPGVSEEAYKRENYRLYCIRKDGILAGWLSFYLEYRQKDAAYLSVLYIKEAYRSGGIGAEVLDALTARLTAAHVKTVRLHCSLRNALALRFWVNNGFRHIVRVECDGNLFPGNFGGVELMKTLF